MEVTRDLTEVVSGDGIEVFITLLLLHGICMLTGNPKLTHYTCKHVLLTCITMQAFTMKQNILLHQTYGIHHSKMRLFSLVHITSLQLKMLVNC